jgi:Protein of unknown function (DUF445)
MQFAIRHFMRGRVRIFVPALCRRQPLAEATLIWLRSHDAVKRARINYDCASLIVEYDVAREKLLRLLLGRLRLMAWRDLRAVVTPEQAAGEPQLLAAHDLLDSPPLARIRFPLIWPTISLVLTFSLNPIARAINAPLMLWNAYPIALRAWRIWRRETRLNVDFLDTLAITASVAKNHHTAGALIIWLDEKPTLPAMTNRRIRLMLLRLFLHRRVEIGSYIARVVETWDASTLVSKLELQVGNDLQYVRINGTLVGGLVGLSIFAATRWFESL